MFTLKHLKLQPLSREQKKVHIHFHTGKKFTLRTMASQNQWFRRSQNPAKNRVKPGNVQWFMILKASILIRPPQKIPSHPVSLSTPNRTRSRSAISSCTEPAPKASTYRHKTGEDSVGKMLGKGRAKNGVGRGWEVDIYIYIWWENNEPHIITVLT